MQVSKENALIEQALDVFYRHGFAATGMDRLVAETGISKTSMYKYFGSKEGLIVAVLKRRDELFCRWLFGRMSALAATPAGQLLALFDALDEWFAEPGFGGCMFIRVSAEFQEQGDPLRAEALAHKRLVYRGLRRLARQAGAADPSLLARQMLMLKDGAIIAASMGYSRGAAQDARQLARGALQSAGLLT